jgi:hypothetical protein
VPNLTSYKPCSAVGPKLQQQQQQQRQHCMLWQLCLLEGFLIKWMCSAKLIAPKLFALVTHCFDALLPAGAGSCIAASMLLSFSLALQLLLLLPRVWLRLLRGQHN